MKHIICSIYDKATQAYMRPFTAQTPGQAIRLFEDIATQPDHDIARHPEHGDFTDHDGQLIPIEPVCLRRAHEISPLVVPLKKETA